MKTPSLKDPVKWYRWHPGMTNQEEARLREGAEHFKIDKPLGEESHLKRMLKFLEDQEAKQ